MHRLTDLSLRSLATALAALLMITSVAGAQAVEVASLIPASQARVEVTPTVNAGDTVRVWAPTARLDGAIGTLVRLDTLGLRMAGQSPDPSSPGRQMTVPLPAITRLDLLRWRGR